MNHGKVYFLRPTPSILSIQRSQMDESKMPSRAFFKIKTLIAFLCQMFSGSVLMFARLGKTQIKVGKKKKDF